MTGRTYKVLVVDDDESVRESLRKLLCSEGYQVLSVAGGTEAVESFRQEQDPIDLLLVDLNMPLKNGWVTIDRLLEVNPALPVVVVTGQPNQYEMAEAAGVNALVEKPVDVPSLLLLIQGLLAGSVDFRLRHADHRKFRLSHLRAASSASRYLWTEQIVTPYFNGGLNE